MDGTHEIIMIITVDCSYMLSSLRFLQYIPSTQPSKVNHIHNNSKYVGTSLSFIKYPQKTLLGHIFFLHFLENTPAAQLNFMAFYWNRTTLNSVWFCLQLANPQVPIITSLSYALQRFSWFPISDFQKFFWSAVWFVSNLL